MMTHHGMYKSPIYGIWECVMSRCNNPNNTAYHHYGGRGIKVCARWQKFENFLQDMGPRPARKTIDRIDVNGNYELSNCRWATMREQMRNRRDNVHYEYRGRKQILPDWSAEFGINPSTVASRMKRGWSLERSLTQEVY